VERLARKCETDTLRLMTTRNVTIGIELFVGPPAKAGTRPFSPFAALRACAISALARSVGDRKQSACVLFAAGEILAETAPCSARHLDAATPSAYGSLTIREAEGRSSPRPR
jgi:hypothetical protein